MISDAWNGLEWGIGNQKVGFMLRLIWCPNCLLSNPSTTESLFQALEEHKLENTQLGDTYAGSQVSQVSVRMRTYCPAAN
eukprot:1156832-Pelagomonas_calceolata.AAC.2